MSLSTGALKLPFDVCFPAHLKWLLKRLTESSDQPLAFRRDLQQCLDFLLRYWTATSVGALERLAGQKVECSERPTWSETLKLLRYSVMAWESHPQSSFRTLLRLGFFEASNPPRPRLQCRWLGIAGEWSSEVASAERSDIWENEGALPGSTTTYLELLGEWLRASRPLFVKLNRRYQMTSDGLSVYLEDGRGKQLPLTPALPWDDYVAGWTLEQIEVAEKATSLDSLPSQESLPSLEETQPLEPEFEPEPVPEVAEPEQVGPASDELDALLGLDSPRPQTSPRWRPRPLELPESMPAGLRSQLEVSRRSLLDYLNLGDDHAKARQALAAGMLSGLSCLLELTARVACAGLAQVSPLPEPLRVALQQPVPAGQSVKLLHFAWTALQDYPEQPALRLMQELFFEISAPEVPRLHARWLGLPDGPMFGLQHVLTWVRLSSGQVQLESGEFQVQLRELLDALQLWLAAGESLWRACDPDLFLRPDGHWSGWILLNGERILLDPDAAPELPLEEVLASWKESCQSEKPPFFLWDESLEFVESVAGGSGLILAGPPGLGKSFLLSEFVRQQPQVGKFRCCWLRVNSADNLALEQLNASLEELRQHGFGWHSLGSAALADLQRHSPREQLMSHYFAALQERNARHHDQLRIILVEDEVSEPASLLWCQLPLPAPFVWLAASQVELPSAWTVACPPARLPITIEDAQFQKLALDQLSSLLDWSRPQLQELLTRSGYNLLVVRLWAGALAANLVSTYSELPAPEEAAKWTFTKLLEDRSVRGLVLLLGCAGGLPIEEICQGPWAASLAPLLQRYSWLVVESQGYLRLRHSSWETSLRELEGDDRRDAVGQFCGYLVSKLDTQGHLLVPLERLLAWIVAERANEAAWGLLQSAAFRTQKEELVHRYDGSGQGHRKILFLNDWLACLELALYWGREKSPLQLHQVLEEQLWSYSSRALTYRNLGRLNEALLDVEQSIAGFRPLVEQRPELLNGLAAALNRRSEILRELGRPAPALEDADSAIALYRSISDTDPLRWEPLLALAVHHRSVLLEEMGRVEDAEGDLKQALELYHPHRDQLRSRLRLDLVQAYLSRARLAARRGDGLLARDDASRCLELLERFEESWTELRVMRAQAQTQLAEAHRLLADELKALESSDQATGLWKELIDEGRLDLRGVYSQELCRRGQLLYEVGRLDDAFAAAQPSTEMLLQLVEAEGRSDLPLWLSQALLLRGRIWLRQGRSESAKRDLSLAFHYLTGQACHFNDAANRVLVDTVVLLSQLNLQMGQTEQAVDHLKTCLEWVQDPQSENRALLESLLGRACPAAPEALEAHHRALELYAHLVDEQGQYQLLPRLAEAHLGRARTYRLLGEEEKALADANQGVELLTFLSEKGGDPEVLRLLPPARFEAAEILGSLGELERARQHLTGGLEDLELLQADLGSAEYFLERSRALLLQASFSADEAAAELFGEALQLLGQARAVGAETQFQESEARRARSQVLLRLGRTGEALEELLGEGSAEQAGQLMTTMLGEARQWLQERSLGEALAAYQRLIQVGQLVYAQDTSGQVVPVLVRAYQERALAQWNPSNPEASLGELESAIALCGVWMEGSAEFAGLMASLLESRARLLHSVQKSTLAMADVSRALDCCREGAFPELEQSLLWLRLELDGQDAASWLDLRRLESLLLDGPSALQARLRSREANWLEARQWTSKAVNARDKACALWQEAYLESPVTEVAEDLAQALLERFSTRPESAPLVTWALWLGDQSRRHPHLGHTLALDGVRQWLQGAPKEEVEKFAPVWLALLAEHPDSPDSFYQLVPFCLKGLQMDDHEGSSWPNLLDLLFKRASDETLARLTWEGETLAQLLALPRAELSQNPDLEMALADCLRRWAELPPHRLALAGLSSEALGAWLEG
jgi:hypothetical protein